MAKIIVFGDIDISALYLKINDEKEISVTGKRPKSFTVSSGTNHIFATTVTKLERVSNRFSDGGFLSTVNSAVQNATNTTLEGNIDFAEDDVLLIQVEQRGLKTVVYSKLVSATEVKEYIDISEVEEYGTKKTGKKIVKALLVLGILLVALLFVAVLFVFMMRSGPSPDMERMFISLR